MFKHPRFVSLLAVVAATWLGAVPNPVPAADDINFNRDIRPLLSDTCFACHGPDAEAREAELRLDMESGAKAVVDGKSIVAPGKPDQSELLKRIASNDPDVQMPPSDFEKRLTAEQVELFRQWIQQGAKWSKHWSFEPPIRPALPDVESASWIRNGIDAFVLARLEREGLSPSAEASRETLIRRVTLDLTGLPPIPAEVDAFVNDSSPDAYERLVDRLLQSPRYGERMAVQWLDAARYADTSGYQSDGPRYMWRWRDWVIEAYNAGKPFDEFTIEQLAGDMLRKPTLDQLIATGFNRNHRGNAEGGIVPEEYAVEYVVDRVDTTFTVWQGLTMGCGRCHNHKYDPLTQEDFYSAFAFFNNIPENGRALKEGNSPPYALAPTREQQAKYRAHRNAYAQAQNAWNNVRGSVPGEQAKWEAALNRKRPLADWTITEGLAGRFDLDANFSNSAPARKPATKEDAAKPKSVGATSFSLGRRGHAAAFDGTNHIECGDVGNFGYFDRFTLSAWIYPTQPTGTIVSRMTLVDRGDGYNLHLQDGKVQLNLVKRWLDDSLRVESTQPLALNQWHHVAVTYNGGRTADSITLMVDGQRTSIRANLDGINQSMASTEPLRIGHGNSPFHGLIDDVRVYSRDVHLTELPILAAGSSVDEIVRTPARTRTGIEFFKLREYFQRVAAPASIRDAFHQLISTRSDRDEFHRSLPTVMVMKELPKPRETHILIRGEYDKPGEPVTANVPKSLPPLDNGDPKNRLGFARWLVNGKNPLTARVAVNRYWQLLFGAGLVRSTEDFGAQGQPPSHPQLLDWLATEFVDSGWDVKGMLRQVVTSATYRQSSRVTRELLDRDPENRLLTRAPRYRLPAEVIRDQALAASGQLSERLGGESVRPYQPAGLWQEIASDQNYNQSTGTSLYRRSMYTFWKRTVAPPVMVAFDATAREACTVRRSRTNTPLQALALMNDVTFVEAARSLAQVVLLSDAKEESARLMLGFRRVLGRSPRPQELAVLKSALKDHLANFRDDPKAAEALVEFGDSPVPNGISVTELAAYTATLDLVLNLDEFVTRE